MNEEKQETTSQELPKKMGRPPKENTNEPSITDLISRLEAQQKQIAELTRMASGVLPTMEEVPEHTARVVFVGDKAVVDCVKSKTAVNENGDKEIMVELVLEDGTTKWEFYSVVNRELPAMTAKIVKVDYEDKSYTQGVVEAKELPDGGWNMAYKGYKVPVKVKIMKPIYTLELPDGRQLKAKKVNI